MFPRWAATIAIAIATWGMPACGKPSVEYVTAPLQPEAWAIPDQCVIVFNRWGRLHPIGSDLVDRCTVLVHEWGHVTGHPHSNNPDDVMYSPGPLASDYRTEGYYRCIARKHRHEYNPHNLMWEPHQPRAPARLARQTTTRMEATHG